MENITIVTGLLDIGRGSITGRSHRAYSVYLSYFSQLMQTKFPVYVVGDELACAVARNRRNSPSYVIQMTADDISSFPSFTEINLLARGHRWPEGYKDTPQAILDGYLPICLQKIRWLQQAAEVNPFGTTYFLWVDGGIARFFEEFQPRLIHSLERVIMSHATDHLMLIQNSAINNLHGFPRAVLEKMCGTTVQHVNHAAIFAGTLKSINATLPLYEDILQETIRMRLPALEETILTILAHRHPNLVSIPNSMVSGCRDFMVHLAASADQTS